MIRIQLSKFIKRLMISTLIVLALVIYKVSMNLPGQDGYKKSEQVLQVVATEYPPLNNRDPSKGPTMYVRPHPDRVSLNIYGIVDVTTQEKVISIVQSKKFQFLTDVTFYRNEVFIEKTEKNGGVLKERVMQRPLREELISSN